MSVKGPPLMLISRTPPSKQVVVPSKVYLWRKVSCADDEVMLIDGLTSRLSPTFAPSGPRAEFGAVSELAAVVVQSAPPAPEVEVVHPGREGRGGDAVEDSRCRRW